MEKNLQNNLQHYAIMMGTMIVAVVVAHKFVLPMINKPKMIASAPTA